MLSGMPPRCREDVVGGGGGGDDVSTAGLSSPISPSSSDEEMLNEGTRLLLPPPPCRLPPPFDWLWPRLSGVLLPLTLGLPRLDDDLGLNGDDEGGDDLSIGLTGGEAIDPAGDDDDSGDDERFFFD